MIPATGTFTACLNLVFFCLCRYNFSSIVMCYKDMQMSASRKSYNKVIRYLTLLLVPSIQRKEFFRKHETAPTKLWSGLVKKNPSLAVQTFFQNLGLIFTIWIVYIKENSIVMPSGLLCSAPGYWKGSAVPLRCCDPLPIEVNDLGMRCVGDNYRLHHLGH